MSLLDEWQAPEPSPYFDVRLNARLREEAATAKQPAGWLQVAAQAGAGCVVRPADGRECDSGSHEQRASSESANMASQQWRCNPRSSREQQSVIYRRLEKNQTLYSRFRSTR